MDLGELDDLLEDLIDRFGAIDPNETYSQRDFLRTIEDANPDNVDHYINLLKNMGVITEINYKGGGKYVPDDTRYGLGTGGLELYFKRQENKTQKRLTGALIILAAVQLLAIGLQIL